MGFSFLKYPRERFENANICIFPTFQVTVGSHLKPSLPVVMATLNQFNSNLFVVSVNSPLAKISQYISIHMTYCSLNFILMNSIERGLINLCKWSIGKLNKLNLKIIL